MTNRRPASKNRLGARAHFDFDGWGEDLARTAPCNPFLALVLAVEIGLAIFGGTEEPDRCEHT